MDIIRIQEQIDNNRRQVAFDSYDITVRQLYDMVVDQMIDISPEYQRHFVWSEMKQSQLIESLILGIPIPSIFMATNRDSSWEVIDGLQRLTTIINFIGTPEIIRQVNSKCEKLKLSGLDKLDSLNGIYFEDLPRSINFMFMTRPVKVTVLNDRSDFEIRYDLFERLNTGGVTLHPQEIRNCIYLGPFKDFIMECSEDPNFKSVVKMTRNAARTGNMEELVLKFFAYLEDRDEFVHSVKGFLNDYMKKKTERFRNRNELVEIFSRTFETLNEYLPDGIVRGNRKNITPLILFEAISIGVADLLHEGTNINAGRLRNILDNEELKTLTTGATNSRSKLYGRINYVKEHAI